MVPNPEHRGFGYEAYIKGIDAIVMGRVTFDTVCSFDMEWPYDKPVFVLSKTLVLVPEKYRGKAEFVRGSLSEHLESKLYLDALVQDRYRRIRKN